jgi:hypothetical protein
MVMSQSVLVKGEPSDKSLIEWFQANYSSMNFIGSSKNCPTQVIPLGDTVALITSLRKTREFHTKENLDILMKLWKNMLGDAIIFLKSQDSREEYHDGEIFGIDKLWDIINAFGKFENILYGANDFYREHIAHSFRVFLLGEGMIRDNFSFKDICILGENNISKKVKISKDEKEAMWCIIALTHDIGYPLEDIDKINEKTREMIRQYGKVSVQELAYLFPPQRQAIDDLILRFISSDIVREKKGEYTTHTQFKYLLKFYRAYERFDHGIISCLVLMRELVFFLESDFLLDRRKKMDEQDARQFLIRQTILRAIASHNCEEIYHLSGRNFLFLLLICDELQEWGRPKMDEVSKGSGARRIVIINKFKSVPTKNGLNIDYEVHFEVEEGRELGTKELYQISKEAGTYFIRKTKKYIKILRSAVDGKHRSISLHFMVEDRIADSKYEFELKHPGKKSKWLYPTLKVNGTKQSLKEIVDYVKKPISRKKIV